MLIGDSNEFTPGDWIVIEIPNDGHTNVLIQTDDEIIAKLVVGPRRSANARLIVSAPAMFMALQMVIANPHPLAGPLPADITDSSLIERYDKYTKAVDLVFSVIEKAVQS